DIRERAILRKHQCEVGPWKRSRAELMETAALLRQEVTSKDPTPSEPALRRRWQTDPPSPAAVKYLALYAYLRRFMLHQRGRIGLVSFTHSFERFSRLSKGRGSRHGIRRAVAAILERFEHSGAAAVELRPTLDDTRIATQRKLREIVLGYFEYLSTTNAARPVIMGLVPSLFKQQVTNAARAYHGRAYDRALQQRLATQQQVWAHQADGFVAILEEVPVLRNFIVG